MQAKTGQVLDDRIKLIHSEEIITNQVFYITEVLLSSDKVIGSHRSVSKVYANKKAVKDALKYVLDVEAQTPAFQLFEQKKAVANEQQQLREKAEKQK